LKKDNNSYNNTPYWRIDKMKKQIKEKMKSPQYDKSLLKSFGDDVFVSANVEIRRPHLVSVGSHVAIDSGFYITTGAEIGDYIHIGPYITVIGGSKARLIMDDFTVITGGCRIICGTDEMLGKGLVSSTIPEKYRDKLIIKPVIFEKFSVIGTNTIVMPGVTIGEGSVVGACSLVTKDTESWTIYKGNPAKPYRKRPKDKLIKYAKELGYL
jgi:acetyltransferase-like isoleucine patch superfamily enzyme